MRKNYNATVRKPQHSFLRVVYNGEQINTAVDTRVGLCVRGLSEMAIHEVTISQRSYLEPTPSWPLSDDRGIRWMGKATAHRNEEFSQWSHLERRTTLLINLDNVSKVRCLGCVWVFPGEGLPFLPLGLPSPKIILTEPHLIGWPHTLASPFITLFNYKTKFDHCKGQQGVMNLY